MELEKSVAVRSLRKVICVKPAKT